MASIDDLLQPTADLERRYITHYLSICEECRSDVQDVEDLFPGQQVGWYSLCGLHAQVVRAIVDPVQFARLQGMIAAYEEHTAVLSRIQNGYAYIANNPEQRDRAEAVIQTLLLKLPPRYIMVDTTSVARAIEELRHTTAFWRQVETIARELIG